MKKSLIAFLFVMIIGLPGLLTGCGAGSYYPSLEACFTGPQEAEVGERVTFDASCSYIPSNKDVLHRWFFNRQEDHSCYDEIECKHSFKEPGEYRVRLTLKDPCCNEDSTTKPITVLEPLPKDAIISLNKGNPVYCSPGEIVTTPLILEGWGNDVRTTVWYKPAEVQFAGSWGLEPWNLRQTDHNPETGRIILHLDTPVTREERGQEVRVAEVKFLCSPISGGKSELDLSNTEIYSGDQQVTVLAQIGTEIIVQ